MMGMVAEVLLQLLGALLLLLAWAALALYMGRLVWWAAASGAALLLWAAWFGPPVGWLLLVLLAWAAPTLLWMLPEVRRMAIVRPLWRRLRKRLPALSDTEREALEAGEAGWETALFAGTPNWGEVLRGEPVELSEREQAFLDGPVERLCAMLDDWQISVQDFDLPAEAWQCLRQEKFFGMTLPEEYGGLGFSARAHSEVVVKIASRSVTAAVTVMVPNSLGPGKLLLHYGTPEQKERYLPRLAQGEEVPCFGLTGPHAGSDAASIPDTGVVCRQPMGEEEVLGILLNWEKRYITLAPVATLLGLAFRLYDPEGLLEGPRDRGITLALVAADAPGVEIGMRHMPLQVPFMNGPIRGRDVFIPLDQVIGGREGVGRGWRMLMECLGEGRSLSLPALAAAAAKHVARRTGAYAAVRRQFEQPIARFEGVQAVLAAIGGNAYLMDAVRVEVARLVDRQACSSVASAIAKQQLTERMRRVVLAGMDIHAGAGICVGPRNAIARLYQAVPIAITVEGTNLLTRNMIIFGQGLARCHPHLLREMECLRMDADAEALEAFEQEFCQHVGATVRNACRTLLLGMTGGRWPVPAALPASYRALARQAACFAWAVDILLLRYGGSLKRRERLSARLADMLAAQYMAVCVIRRYQAEGALAEERPLRDWALAECRRGFDAALDGLLGNLDAVWLRLLLRMSTRPLGSPPRAHRDAADRAVAQLLTTPGPVRERLCTGIHHDPNGPGEQLEQAFAETVELDPVRQAVREALRDGRIAAYEHGIDWEQVVQEGVLTAAQAEKLRQADRRMDAILAVDEFEPDAWGREGVRQA